MIVRCSSIHTGKNAFSYSLAGFNMATETKSRVKPRLEHMDLLKCFAIF